MYTLLFQRLVGAMRFGRCETDEEVRWRMKAPSIECILARARLNYLRRLLCCKPRALVALLSSRFNGEPLPWVKLVLADMRSLKSSVRSCEHLPDPADEPLLWFDFMESKAKWKHALACFTFVESQIGAVSSCGLRNCAHSDVKCTACSKAFLTTKHCFHICVQNMDRGSNNDSFPIERAFAKCAMYSFTLTLGSSGI